MLPSTSFQKDHFRLTYHFNKPELASDPTSSAAPSETFPIELDPDLISTERLCEKALEAGEIGFGRPVPA